MREITTTGAVTTAETLGCLAASNKIGNTTRLAATFRNFVDDAVCNIANIGSRRLAMATVPGSPSFRIGAPQQRQAITKFGSQHL